MSAWLLLALAFGLSMDAFAVSVTNGMCYRMPLWKNAVSSGVAFGSFQALMPLAGYFAGSAFSSVIESVDHWIALILLGIIGVKMIVEAVKDRKNPEAEVVREFNCKTLVIQAVATSIDALAVGVGLGVMKVNIGVAAACIGAVTFVCGIAGVCIGKKFGGILGDKATLAGGVVLVLIGLRIFTEHVFA